jgi:hypothetical protein
MNDKLSEWIPTRHHRGLLWWLLVLAVGFGPFAMVQPAAEREHTSSGEVAR